MSKKLATNLVPSCCCWMLPSAAATMMLLLLLPLTAAHPVGAPADACITRTPNHGARPQTSAAPYGITFSPDNFSAGGSNVRVTISKTGETSFKGFLLTAHYSEACLDQGEYLGSFTPIAKTQHVCNGSAVTHSVRNTEDSLSFQWTPPATSEGHVRFRATFVQSQLTFWVDVESTDILMDSNLGAGNSVCDGRTAEPPTTPTGTIVKDPACGVTKGCYSDCSGTECSYLMTWQEGSSPDDTVLITMMGRVGNNAPNNRRYIAVGLSKDDNMGDDSVHYCINEGSGVFTSYNEGQVNKPIPYNKKLGVSGITVSLQDGVLTCSFSRIKAGGGENGELFALDRDYTLLWAEGPGSSAGLAQHYDIPQISTSVVSLLDFAVDIGGSVDFPLVKAHGSLMVVAWIFFASIGIVFARYFKTVWNDQMWFGQKIWFQIHRGCMVLCLLTTVAAFIIIFVEVEGYSDINGEGYQKAHPILGILVTILTVINPIMALFRPHPGTENRPIFNWFHWAVGFGGYTLAVITVFFGMKMHKAGAPDYILYILVAFVVWMALVQILLEITQCKGNNSGKSDQYELKEMSQGSNDHFASSPKVQSTLTKRVLLALHLVVVSAFTIALILVLNIGEED